MTTRYIPPVVLPASSCPTGELTVGTPFSRLFGASGGTGAFEFTGSDLPPGIGFAGNMLAGVPTAAGTYSYTIIASSPGAQSAEIRCSLRVLPGPLKITTSCPTETREGDRYTFPILATGGLGNGLYDISINGLPPGLVATRGGIQGVPGVQGDYNLQIQGPQRRAGSYAVVPAAGERCAGTSSGATGHDQLSHCRCERRRSQLQCFGDRYGSVHVLVLGTGVATADSGGIDRVDQRNRRDTGLLSGVGDDLECNRIHATDLLRDGQRSAADPFGRDVPGERACGNAARSAVSVSGGTGPYQWTLTSGTGLAASSAAGTSTRITGAPSEPGTLPVAVSVTDASGNRREFRCSIEVTPRPLSISAVGCPTAPVNRPANVSVSLTGSGGQGDYSWRLSGPPWLTLSSGTGANVTVSGAPTAPGEVAFTATLSDQVNTPQGTFTCSFNVPAVTAPTFQFNGLSASVGASETGDLQLIFSAPSPVPLTAVVTLAFEPDVALPGVLDNPLVQFTNGRQRTITVTIPAGQTTIPLGARVNLSNIAGTVRVIVSSLMDVDRQLLGTDRPTSELRIARAAR